MKRDGFIAGGLIAIVVFAALGTYQQRLDSEYSAQVTDSGENPIATVAAAPPMPMAAVAPVDSDLAAFQIPAAMAPVLRQMPRVMRGMTEARDGFLGSRTALTDDGETYIALAWFKDEPSLMRWYNGRMRPALLQPAFPQLADGKPKFMGTHNPKAPVMAMATITPDPSMLAGQNEIPATQMSLEFFSAAASPLALGTTFSPAKATPPGFVKPVAFAAGHRSRSNRFALEAQRLRASYLPTLTETQ